MNCPKCGREVNGKFCPHCGAAMYGEETVVLSQANNPWAQKKAAEEAAAVQAQEPAAAPQSPVFQAPNYAREQAPVMPNNPNPVYAPNPGYMPNPNAALGQQPMQQPQAAPNPGFIPNQGSNNGAQNVGAFVPPANTQGNTPARQLVRRLATSPAFLLAILAFTLSFAILAYKGYESIVSALDYMRYYQGNSEEQMKAISVLVSTGVTLLLSLISVIALWSIFGSAAKKNSERMSTGGLTLIKVFMVIGEILTFILMLAVVSGVIFCLINKFEGDIFNELKEHIRQYAIQMKIHEIIPDITLEHLVIATGAVLFLTALLAFLFFARTVRSLNTAKRVIRIGAPDDRVSVFVAILCFLGVIGMVIGLFADKLPNNLSGWLDFGNTALSAIATLLFAIVLLKFRSGMRKLGVRKGVMQR